jgi:hypothetical protein
MGKAVTVADNYRIILGDACTICRAVSRISFPENRPPQLPIAGCRDPDGCRCKLPLFAPAAGAEDVAELAQALPNSASESRAADIPTPGLRLNEVQPELPAPPAAARPSVPDWSQPSAITQRRRHALAELTALYHQHRIQGVRIATAPGCCAVCAEVAASLYEPSIAPPLPIIGCVNGWQCRCQYAEEPLPLDDRGRQAMQRLDSLERERELRRAGIAIGGPRPLHILVIVAGVLAGILAISALGAGTFSGGQTLASILIAAALALVAVMAVRRLRPIPSPAWTYAAGGLALAAVALWPLFGLQLPAIAGLRHLQGFSEVSATPHLTTDALAGLSRVQQAMAALGALLLLLGLVDLAIAPNRSAPVRSKRL